MRTISYQEVRKAFASLADAEQGNLSASQSEAFRTLFNHRFRAAWLRTDWPFAYAIKTATVGSDGAVDLSSETDVDIVWTVWDAHPEESFGVARTLAHQRLGDELYVRGGASGDTVYLYYRSRETEFTGDDYSESATYSSGDVVYYDALGDWYKANATTSAGEDPADTPAKWVKLAVPFVFRGWLAKGCAADWMQARGDVATAGRLSALAEKDLLTEIWDLERRGEEPPLTVRAHSTIL